MFGVEVLTAHVVEDDVRGRVADAVTWCGPTGRESRSSLDGLIEHVQNGGCAFVRRSGQELPIMMGRVDGCRCPVVLVGGRVRRLWDLLPTSRDA